MPTCERHAGDWCEPWVGEYWEAWDLNAGLTGAGLTVAAIDPDRLPAPARDLLWEWAVDWQRRQKAARDASSE